MLYLLFSILFALSILTSAISRDTAFLSLIISFIPIGIGSVILFKSKNTLKVPSYFPLMLVFAAILYVYVIFLPEKAQPLYYAILFTQAIVYWLIFYNMRNGFQIVERVLIFISILYTCVYLLATIFNINLISLGGLIYTDFSPTRHFYLGDLWSFTLAIYICSLLLRAKAAINGTYKKFVEPSLIIGLGAYSIIISGSRTAVLALAVGVGYFLIKRHQVGRLAYASVAILTTLFLIFSFGKTTLFDRPYFSQSLQAFPKHLFGVGMGNFGIIEQTYRLSGVLPSQLSFYTHNIYLESLSGVGIFSVLFLTFIILLIRDVLNAKEASTIWGALIIAMFVDFMIDTFYTVPGIIWMFFAAIAIFQYSSESIGSS